MLALGNPDNHLSGLLCPIATQTIRAYVRNIHEVAEEKKIRFQNIQKMICAGVFGSASVGHRIR